MNDRWYYAEGERPVGPFTLDQFKKLLRQLPNGKATLVWRAGRDQWQKASEIVELAFSDGAPPPIPPSPLSPQVQLLEQPAQTTNGMSRKSVAAFVGSYFIVALLIAIFIEYRKPFATLARAFPGDDESIVIGLGILF
jgi:hypothetical protein